MHNLTSKVKINQTCQTELLPQLDLLTLLCNLVEELCQFVGRVHGSGGSTNSRRISWGHQHGRRDVT